MLNVVRARAYVVASCLACLAMAAASSARAKDERSANKQVEQATASQQKALPSTQQTAAQQQADQQNQKNARADQHENKADQTHQATQHIQSNGKQRTSLGVTITSDKDENGVLVVRILPNTTAQRMGLQRHDRIVSLNGEKVRSADDFIAAISGMNPGDRVALKVVRNGNERTIRGELEGYSESIIETQGPSGNHEYRRFQSYIKPNRPNSDQATRGGKSDNRDGTQANYESQGNSSDLRLGDIEARVTRLEQRIEHIAQQIEDRVTNNSHGQATSAQKSAATNSVKK